LCVIYDMTPYSLARWLMPRAVDLLKQGRNEELWQMCCGYLKLNIREFMEIQERLLLEQLELLNNSALGMKIMGGARPRTLEEFRWSVPLTTYKDYGSDLINKREDILPAKPSFWVRTSGRSGDFPCKWVPMTADYAEELSRALYGVGMLSCCDAWGETFNIPHQVSVLYSVAPRPYISGTFADLLRLQTPLKYLPPLEKAEGLSYEDRIRLGFEQAMTKGVTHFFGLSLVLVKVGDKISNSSNAANILPYMKSPRAMARLIRGKIRAKLAGRTMLPRDLWSLKGIIGSGVDSWIYKDKIQELWGKMPLDLYSCTEGGIIATQTWDFDGMTFIPQLNFLEFIPEEEQAKLKLDRSYRPQTLLLDEVKAGEEYELVITNFHGGAMVRYRIGDIIKIKSLSNEKLGIGTPQMLFERRSDDMINFMVIKMTEKQIWQALEKTGIRYEDWAAYKIPGEPILHLLVEPQGDINGNKKQITADIQRYIIDSGRSSYTESGVPEDWRDSLDFKIELTLLPHGTFAKYMKQRQAEGADLAHIKPPHVNPPEKVISLLLADTAQTILVTKTRSTREEKIDIKQVIP
jgi:hypothetical protein